MPALKQEYPAQKMQPHEKFDDLFKMPKPAPNLKSPTLFDEPYVEPLGSMNDIFKRYLKEARK